MQNFYTENYELYWDEVIPKEIKEHILYRLGNCWNFSSLQSELYIYCIVLPPKYHQALCVYNGQADSKIYFELQRRKNK